MAYQVLDDDGQELDAHFDVEGNAIIFHSRGGRKGAGGQNTEYGKGLRVLLGRIAASDLRVSDAWVDSSTVQNLPIEDRRIVEAGAPPSEPSKLFTQLSERMKSVGRGEDAAKSGGNSTKRIRLVVDGGEGASLISVLGGRHVSKDFRSAERLPASDFDKVKPEHAFRAVQRLRDGFDGHSFDPSIDYDVVLEDGSRLPPKAVFGLAATEALGFEVIPKHFTGGEGSICFNRLREWGYLIESKTDAQDGKPPKQGLDLSFEDKEWAEGKPKLVSHLKRERSSGLSRAKKSAFRAEHGKLFCENCKIDPSEQYGKEHGEACIEVHHTRPVSEMPEGSSTRLEDVVCLCANCHRIEHKRLRAGEDSMISPELGEE